MNLRIFETADDLARAAARTIVQRVAGMESASVALSGGSTPRPAYALLGQRMDELADVAITWVVVDERYVPQSDPQSNAGMIRETLFAQGIPPRHRFLHFRTDLADPAESARFFAASWDLTRLDVAILGIGDDGHTASLFPETAVLGVEDRIASEVFVPRLHQWRVTLTMPVIRAAALRVVIVAGGAKAPALRDVKAGVPHPITRATAGVETWWLVDGAAAALL